MSGGTIPFTLDYTRRPPGDFFLVPVSYHSPSEEHDSAPFTGGGGRSANSPRHSPDQPPPPPFSYPFPDTGANDPGYGQQYAYPPQPTHPHPYGPAPTLHQPYRPVAASAPEPWNPLYGQQHPPGYPSQPFGSPSYRAVPESHTPPLEPPGFTGTISLEEHLQPSAPPSDSSGSPEPLEDTPETRAAMIARDEENEAYIRNKLRVPPDVPVTLKLAIPRSPSSPQATLPTLAMLAIQGCERSPKELTLQEITAEIEKHIPYYSKKTTNWKASIRHALSLHQIFRRRQRKEDEAGPRGGYWHLDFRDGEGTKRLRKRNSRAQRTRDEDDDFEDMEEDPSSESFDDDDSASTGSSGRHAPYPAVAGAGSSSFRGRRPIVGASGPSRLGGSPLLVRTGSPSTSTASPPPFLSGPRQPPLEVVEQERLPAGGISRGQRAGPVGYYGRGGVSGGASERDARFVPAGSSAVRGAHIRPHGPAHRGGRPAGEPAQDRKGKGRG